MPENPVTPAARWPLLLVGALAGGLLVAGGATALLVLDKDEPTDTPGAVASADSRPGASPTPGKRDSPYAWQDGWRRVEWTS
ncbi:hypothetical protein [Streptomyces triculaminicus]|uniref:hypothetical protein n=1 Tax=Streptomyces triculaminicus TaxID=2816232 RepID=UPI0037D8A593